jgi:hypothetical protein
MTTEINKTALNPDPQAAAAAEALALRRLSSYRAAKSAVEHYGGDASQMLEPPEYHDLEARYAEAMRTVVLEPPETASSELAYLELVEAIVTDAVAPNREGPLMGRDEDLCCALQILNWLHRLANDRDISEAIAKERKTPLPADSHGSYILDQMRAALDRIQAGKGDAA